MTYTPDISRVLGVTYPTRPFRASTPVSGNRTSVWSFSWTYRRRLSRFSSRVLPHCYSRYKCILERPECGPDHTRDETSALLAPGLTCSVKRLNMSIIRRFVLSLGPAGQR